MIVVDATILLSLGARTPHSARASGLLEQGEAFICPQAALTEAVEGARGLATLGHMSVEDTKLLAEALPPLLAGIVSDTILLPLAADLAGQWRLSMSAALCLALARQRELPLASFDPALRAATRAEGVVDALAEDA